MDSSATTRAELYNTAKAFGLQVRSRMTKGDLLNLLAEAAGSDHHQVPPADTAENSAGEQTGPGGRVSAQGDKESKSVGENRRPRIASRMNAFRALAVARGREGGRLAADAV